LAVAESHKAEAKRIEEAVQSALEAAIDKKNKAL